MLHPEFHGPRSSGSALKVCGGGGWVLVVDIPIIIITLHSVELSQIESRVDQFYNHEIDCV